MRKRIKISENIHKRIKKLGKDGFLFIFLEKFFISIYILEIKKHPKVLFAVSIFYLFFCRTIESNALLTVCLAKFLA